MTGSASALPVFHLAARFNVLPLASTLVWLSIINGHGSTEGVKTSA
jgi:hypothetical protein